METKLNKTYIVGVMSGTSLDGVDLAYVVFHGDNNFEILAAQTIPYSSYWVNTLKRLAFLPKGSLELSQKDQELGVYFSKIILEFVEEHKISKLDGIASHGHTIHHQPKIGYTLQIGCGNTLYAATNTTVVYDFRTQDVLLGGQGAPLVPVGDELLFSEYDYCLNLGGFSNVSFKEKGIRKAFDICPVNTVLNHYANLIGLDFDDEGKKSRTGVLNMELLEALNGLSFYQSSSSKSLGVEFLHEHVFPLIKKMESDVLTILRTFVEHIAVQIVLKIKKGSVLVTGGGAYHKFLIERIQKLNSELQIVIPKPKIIDYKEALIFALLGKLKLEGRVNCLSSVTGASKNHSAGVIISKADS